MDADHRNDRMTMMPGKTQHRSEDLTEADFARWRELLRHLPDVRLDRVQAMRDALKFNRYDHDIILDETAGRLLGEIELICGESYCG